MSIDESVKDHPVGSKSDLETDHPLEGKYIVFDYELEDKEGSGYSIQIYKFDNGKLNQWFDPLDYIDIMTSPMSAIGEEQTIIALDLLEKEGVDTLYTVSHTGNFHGIPSSYIDMHTTPEEPETLEEWCQYKQVCEYTDAHTQIVEEREIKLMLYNAINGELKEF